MTEIAVVGITDAGPASLAPAARAAVERAALLCGGERHLAFFPAHSGERFVVRANLAELVARLREFTQPAAILASGDPCCFGVGPILVDRLGGDRVTIYPNVGSMQTAFARLGLAWQDAALLSAHGRPLEAILPAALAAPLAAILTDERNTPAAIAQALLDAGDTAATVDVFEHLDGDAERHVAGSPAAIAKASFAALNVVIVRRAAPRPWPLGLPEDAFEHRRGLITKAEVRAVSLAKLRLHDHAVVWDVGAGCGSVSIEAAALARRGRVFAIERDAEQLALLRANQRRWAAGNVTPVEGPAPAALLELPDPNAVFVGGSGGALKEILRVCMERLRAGGRLVANFATLERTTEAVELAKRAGWLAEVVQVGIARGAGIANLTRLTALNPVFVVTLCAK